MHNQGELGKSGPLRNQVDQAFAIGDFNMRFQKLSPAASSKVLRAAVEAIEPRTLLSTVANFTGGNNTAGQSGASVDGYVGVGGTGWGGTWNETVASATIDDYALNWWRTNQNTKPDDTPERSYYYSSGNFWSSNSAGPYDHMLVFPSDTYEIYAMAAEAHSLALGSQANVGGPFGSEVNLQTAFGFGNSAGEHSAQFNYTIMKSWGYWQQLRFSLVTP